MAPLRTSSCGCFFDTGPAVGVTLDFTKSHYQTMRFDKFGSKDSAFGEPDRWKELVAGAAFDHGILRKTHEGVHLWLIRRWNAFNIAATSLFGLLFSFPVGYFVIRIPVEPIWYVPVGIFSVIFAFMMFWSWHDTMNMANFMATLPAVDRTE